jgi:hypothetical protein
MLINGVSGISIDKPSATNQILQQRNCWHEVAAMEENKRMDQSSIAMLYRGMHGQIIFIDKDHNRLLVNSPKFLQEDL